MTTFRELTQEIAEKFVIARTEIFRGHYLAAKIRKDWPNSMKEVLEVSTKDKFQFDASPGAGQWNSAPWFAVLHPSISTSAQAGFYPVYLFEPEFKTVCLVMGQGAEKLEQAVGKKRAIVELERRADILRRGTTKWKSSGFNEGPFHTMREAAAKRKNKGGTSADPWEVSVAFGKRYNVEALPSDTVLKRDLESMLEIYLDLIHKKVLVTGELDETLAKMAMTGEIPDDDSGNIDGAKRVAYHKQFEYRSRNRSLIKKVKQKLGSVCQACNFEFASLYGSTMEGFIEAHHKVPISTFDDQGTKLKANEDDFMVLCSNCHRAIHAAGCLSLDKFKDMLVGKVTVGSGKNKDGGAIIPSQS